MAALGVLILTEQLPLSNKAFTLLTIVKTALKDVRSHQITVAYVSLRCMAQYIHIVCFGSGLYLTPLHCQKDTFWKVFNFV